MRNAIIDAALGITWALRRLLSRLERRLCLWYVSEDTSRDANIVDDDFFKTFYD